MKICCNCNEFFHSSIVIDGKKTSLSHRKYCLKCNPIGDRKFWRGKEVSTSTVDGKRILHKREFVCKTCGITRFQKTRNNECTSCSSKRERLGKKTKAIEHLGGKCYICGYNKCHQAFDFHHKDPSEKEFELCDFWLRKSWDELIKELNKCILLCSNCHREFHAGLIGILENGAVAKLAETQGT